nr:retrovirus-related Pol polyprotein from transposon TNT 1-94 [Tanacetum cinerariifolium]
MNYLKEQTDGEAMINSIQNGHQPYPFIAQVSLAKTAQNAPPTLKDPKFWTAEEKKTRKIDRLARYILIQGLPNDIYSLIDSNKAAKDLWDALERQMRGSEYNPLALVAEKTNVSKQKGKVVVSSDSEESGSDDFSELKKITALLAKTDDKKVEKNVDEKKRDMSKVKCYNCKKEGHFAKDCKKVKVKDYEYYKAKIDLDHEINTNMVFMAQIQKVLSDSEASSSSVDEKIFEKRVEKANQQSKDFENQNMDLQDKYDILKNQVNTFEEKNNEFNEQIKVLNEKNDDLLDQRKVIQDQLQVKHVVIDTHVECYEKYAKLEGERYEYMIRYSALFDNDKQHREQIADQEVLFDKMSVELVELDKHISMSKTSCDSNNVESKLKRKGHLETFSSVRRPKHSSVIWKKKGSSNTSNVDLSDIIQICLWIIDSGCSKHITGNRALLAKFVEKFLGMVRFGNNDFAVIDGYGDVVIGSMTIKKFYYVKGLGHNLFSVGQFCNKGLEVAFRKSTCFVQNEDGVDLLTVQRVRTDNGTKFKNKTLAKFFNEVGITQQFSTARTPQQNGVLERRNRTLVEAARTMLTFENLPSFLWAEAIATACFTKNRSIIHKCFDKSPYELMNKRKPNIKFFCMFECRCYLLNDYEDVGKLKAKGDIRVFVGYSKVSAAFRIYNKRTHHEIFTTNVETSINEEVFHEEVGVPLSNTQSILNNMIPNGDEASTSYNVFNEGLEDAYFDANTSFHDPSNVHTFYQPCPHEKEWTKDHPLYKLIAFRDADWVSAMQEELDQFTRLKVWRLVSRPEAFPPLGSDVPALALPCHASSCKKMRILALKEVLTFPCKLRSTL